MTQNRRYKIIRVTTWLDFGGVEKRFVNLSMSTSTHELVFLALGRGGWAEREIRKNGKRVICLNANPRIPNILLLWKLFTLFRREKPTVVHTSGSEANFHGLVAAFLARVPVRVGEEIGHPRHSLPYRKLFRFVYSLAQKVVGISQSVIDRIVALGEITIDKAVVVYNPMPLVKERANLPEKTPVTLITVCRLFEIKNLSVLLALTAELKHYSVTLEIVGDGPEMEALVEQSRKLGIGERVVFQGFQKDPIPFLLKADIFILPSFSEGLSNSLLEAMSVGLPCIATRVGGPSELISHGVNGWLVDPLNYQNIKDVVLQVITMPSSERKTVARNASEFVQSNFSLEVYESKIFGLYASQTK